jgi:SAM-dependent methyltransferase
VLEIGGHTLSNCAADLFGEPRFRYHDLRLVASDIPNTIIADITGCADVIPDDSFDVVFSSDVFEHIDRPWLAAQEITRILRPGGILGGVPGVPLRRSHLPGEGVRPEPAPRRPAGFLAVR